MSCLNEAQVQASADGEAPEQERLHAASCPACAARVRERQRVLAELTDAAVRAEMPPPIRHRIDAVLAAGQRAGATRVRETAGRPSRQRAFWSGAVAVAATLAAILIVAPMITRPATVSASEILAASATRLAEPSASGVEVLEYELALDGIPRELMPEQADGTYRIRQVIDHGQPGRFRFTSYAPDGRLLSSIAEDPASRRRVTLVRLDDRLYRFEFDLPADTLPSLPEIERLHMQASIGMMQSSGNQHLQVLETSGGRVYRVDVPQVSTGAPTAVWDLTRAQALIDADDYRVLELSVEGTFMRRPYRVSFKLIDRSIKAPGEVAAAEFEVPEEAGALTLRGEGTAIPLRDTLVAALRELGRSTAK